MDFYSINNFQNSIFYGIGLFIAIVIGIWSPMWVMFFIKKYNQYIEKKFLKDMEKKYKRIC